MYARSENVHRFSVHTTIRDLIFSINYLLKFSERTIQLEL